VTSTSDVAGSSIAALTARGSGHRFVFYGDACSGVPGAPHEATLAATNQVVRRLDPGPEFVIFAGDEIVGLTTDEAELEAQWRYWLDHEMAWLDRTATPLYNTTSNHTTYDTMSERVFTEVLDHLPRNGPPDQQGLSYTVRRDDLLLVFVNTCWSGLGGEGHVEVDWLARVLDGNRDARHRFVVGHHPAFPVNGFSGPYQRELGPEAATAFWDVLVHHRVTAYLCSHILAFDVQVHRGVLQIVSAGAGTAHRMPDETEYLHAVQMAVDDRGLRYQVLDHDGAVRERLSWPLEPDDDCRAWRLSASIETDQTGPAGRPEMLVAALSTDDGLAPIWVGLTGVDRRLTVTLSPARGRSPHYWFGPALGTGPLEVELDVALHRGMGPGGVMWRRPSAGRRPGQWSSLTSASPWGLERLDWPERWLTGRSVNLTPIDPSP
jgi:hypothetical protein